MDQGIQANSSEPNPSEGHVSHLALDIGGSLIKLVYFSRKNDVSVDNNEEKSSKETVLVSNGEGKCPVLQGRLHFAKFETSKINDCLEFIQRNQLHLGDVCRLPASRSSWQ